MYLRLGFAQALVHGALGRQAARGGSAEEMGSDPKCNYTPLPRRFIGVIPTPYQECNQWEIVQIFRNIWECSPVSPA